MRWLLFLALGAAVIGARAHAAPDPLRAAVFRATPPAAALPGQSEPPRDFGMPRTAIEHRFGPAAGVTGSLGFLCGLQPKAQTDGAAAAYGVDPHGRFLGLKLSLPLR